VVVTEELIGKIAEIGVQIVVALVALAGARLLSTIRSKVVKTQEQEIALVSVAQAVAAVWQEFGAAMKEAAKDGKLTEEEKLKLKTLATTRAADLARAHGIDLFRVFGATWVSTTIEAAVLRLKG
jgi:hypothetical protein